MKLFFDIVIGVTFTLFTAIGVLWCCDRLARVLWRDGDPKEPH